MQQATILEQVRELVEQNFRELGIVSTGGIEETILIRNGYYCGRRFAVDSAHAVWFCEEDQLKFYGGDGAMVRVLQQVSLRLASSGRSLSDVA
jgi:hypothetical protein